jgi:hypothetical protein
LANLKVADVKSSMSLLDGINETAADLLKDKPISPQAIRLMRRVTGLRQIEIAELMVNANNFTKNYAEAMVLMTPKDQQLHPEEPKRKEGLTREKIGKMEAEMEVLERDLKAVERNYGENMLNLALAKGYTRKLLDNAKVVRFLNGNYRDMLTEFEMLVAAEAV